VLVQLDRFETGVIALPSAFLFHDPSSVFLPLHFYPSSLRIPVFFFVPVTVAAACSALFTHVWLKVRAVRGGAVEVPFDRL
jgi:hypothetical protein